MTIMGKKRDPKEGRMTPFKKSCLAHFAVAFLAGALGSAWFWFVQNYEVKWHWPVTVEVESAQEKESESTETSFLCGPHKAKWVRLKRSGSGWLWGTVSSDCNCGWVFFAAGKTDRDYLEERNFHRGAFSFPGNDYPMTAHP